MKPVIKPRTYKGTRDFLPDQMVKRQFVIERIKTIFEKYGFEPLETPAIELMDTLGGKYGDEGDKLLYHFVDRGERHVGLRYDLTVPMARVIAMNPQLPKPFKRYQIQPVWRADKPQKGRFREFYQCDIDTVGSESMLADAEIIAVFADIMNSLNFKDFTIRINNRKLLRSLIINVGLPIEREFDVIRSIDKLDKIGLQGVESDLIAQDIDVQTVSNIIRILDFQGDLEKTFQHAEAHLSGNPEGDSGLNEMKDLLHYMEKFGVKESDFKFDLFLARGLDYYTGPIFETVVKEPKIGSVTGGGRYDNLIGMFSKQSWPAVGSSVGLERIITAMEECNMFPPDLDTPVKVLVTIFDKNSTDQSIEIVNLLRKAGINSSLYLGSSKLRGQLGYANDKKIPYVIIAGPDEIAQGVITVKNLAAQTQESVSIDQLSSYLHEK